MKLKLLLLASAAAVYAGPSALAADYIDAAEPIDYVRVCEAAGSGYWVIPGTETCIRIGGYVRWDAIYDEALEEHYDFKTRARLNIWSWTATDYGPLVGFMRGQANSGESYAVEQAYITWNGFIAGYAHSAFDYAGGDGGFTLEQRGYRSDTVKDLIGWGHAPKKGLGFFVSLEENRSSSFVESHPDLLGGFTYIGDMFDARLTGAAVDDFNGYAFMAAATIKLDSIAKGDAIRVIFSYADDADASFTGANKGIYSGVYDSWSAVVSARHYWESNLVSAVTASYVEDLDNDEYGWMGVFSTNYSPAKGLWIGPEFAWIYDSSNSDPDRFWAMLRVIRDF